MLHDALCQVTCVVACFEELHCYEIYDKSALRIANGTANSNAMSSEGCNGRRDATEGQRNGGMQWRDPTEGQRDATERRRDVVKFMCGFRSTTPLTGADMFGVRYAVRLSLPPLLLAL